MIECVSESKLFLWFVKIVWDARTFKKMRIDRIKSFALDCVTALETIHNDRTNATLTASDKLDFIVSINPLLALNIRKTCNKINSLTQKTIEFDAENQKLYLTQLIEALNIFCKKVYAVYALRRDIKERVEKIERNILHQRTYMPPYDFRPKILEEFKKTNSLTLSIKSTSLKDLFFFWRRSEIEARLESARKE